MGKQTLKKVKITVLKVTFNQDLAEEYAVPGYPPCLIHAEGQVFYSNGWQKPSGLCDYAWNSMRDMVLCVAQKGGYILGDGNWLKHKDMAIVSCSDGIKPVSTRLLCHLEKEYIGQLRHILMVSDAIIPEHIAEIPKFRHDFLIVHAKPSIIVFFVIILLHFQITGK